MGESKTVEQCPLKKMDLDYDKTETHRMLAAISFAFMLIVIGIPLWWKTTEVHRATLPYDEIHKLNPLALKIDMTINVYTEDIHMMDNLINHLVPIFGKMRPFRIHLEPVKFNAVNVTYNVIEENSNLHPEEGDLLLVEVSELPENINILISNHRIIYFKKASSIYLLGQVIREVLNDYTLHNKILSIVHPENLINNSKDSNRLRASLGYDVVFTVINSDPQHLKLKWDIKKDIIKCVQPLFNQISLIGEHYLKSQWLYLIDIGENPKKDGDQWLLSYSQLPHIITPLEKKLGSGISKYPSVHMILYVASCKMTPLSFVSENGEQLNSMISPQWGAVQILNPNEDNCLNYTEITVDSQYVMSVFISQFQELLRARNELNFPNVEVNHIQGPYLRSWELDNLYRMRTVEQITTASLTLQSLSKLLGEISNIVINEDVADAINEAVININKATDSLHNGKLKESLKFSKIAFSSSEKAFSDPSLLALLYFPDDQKYAVYIPLFLPIMIPVLMSLKKIQQWLFSRKDLSHKKQD